MTTSTLRLSRPAAIVAAIFTSIGLVSGIAWYVGRSAQVEPSAPGTAAWIPHLVVAVVVVTWLVLAARRSPLGWKVVFAPVTRPTAARIAATVRALNPLRCLGVALVLFIEVYSCWRIGEQVFAGLDPNFVHNAWGGPSYAGAMLCHYLDGVLILLVCHALLLAATRPVRQLASA